MDIIEQLSASVSSCGEEMGPESERGVISPNLSVNIRRYSSLHARHARSMDLIDSHHLVRLRSSTGSQHNRRRSSVSLSSGTLPIMFNLNGGSCEDLLNMASSRVMEVVSSKLHRARSLPDISYIETPSNSKPSGFRRSLTQTFKSYFICGA